MSHTTDIFNSFLIKIVVFINLFIGSIFIVSAQDEQGFSTDSLPKLGLVLSGGGAKGMAHIGVIKVLEEHQLHPDYITGVSMGSIVAALYAMGYTSNQMQEIVTNIDWDELLSDKIPLRDISIFEKEDYPGYPLKVNFNKRLKLSFPSGMIEAQKIQQFFAKLVWKSNLYDDFNQMPIPYRSIAVDIITGKPFVFKKGSLAQAMRSSMSIPSIFAPVEKDDMLLVDGGVSISYPAQACLDMGADVLIGSYTGIKEKPGKSELYSVIDVLLRSSVVGSLIDTEAQKKNTAVFITSNLDGITATDFSKSKEIIKRGEEASRDSIIAHKLNKLKKKFATFKRKVDFKDTTKIWVDQIVVKGCKLTDSKTVLKISELSAKSYVTADLLDKVVTNIYSRWHYKTVSYDFKKDKQGRKLILNVKEKSRGISDLGIHYDNTNGPSLLLKNTYKNLFFKSTLGKLKVAFSENPRVQFNYKYYPAGSRMIEASLNANFRLSKIPDIVKNEGEEFRLGHYMYAHADLNVALSLAPFKSFLLQGKLGKQYSNILLKEGMQLQYNANSINYNLDYLKFKISLNTLNDNYFPTKGILMNTSLKSTFNVHSTKGSTSYFLNDVKDRNIIFNFNYKQYVYILKHLSVIPSVNFGVMASPEFITEKFFLGGINYSLRANAFNFPGIKANYITSDNFLTYGLNGQYRLFKDWYLNGGVDEMFFMNYANYENEDENTIGNIITSWNFGIGTSTKIGPLRLIISQNSEKPKDVYWSFNIGVPF